MAMMRLRREDPRVVGSFRLHRRLGAGGMGVVYLGSDRRGQRVALKVIRPDLAEDQEFRSRFAREVSAARRIRGGCTARLVAADLEADRPWFATQYVPGPSLHDKVVEEGPLSAAEVASIGAALSEGLVAVHEAGVVHRDLKPSNILLSPKGPRIIDFGIAWATGASTLTHVGTAVGSPGFLAPEQVRGAAVTPATDVFSLGATLAYAAMADSPFGHGSSEVMLYRVVHEEPHLFDVHDALAPWSGPAWRRTPRTGRAPCSCPCGSRRSRHARRRDCRSAGLPRSGASRSWTGRPGGWKARRTRSSSPGGPAGRLRRRVPLRGVPRRRARPRPAPVVRAPGRQVREAPARDERREHDERPAGDPTRGTDDVGGQGREAPAGESAAPASAARGLRRGDAAGGAGDRRGTGLPGTGAGAGRQPVDVRRIRAPPVRAGAVGRQPVVTRVA